MALHEIDERVIAGFEAEGDFEGRVAGASILYWKGRVSEVMHAAFLNATNRDLTAPAQERWMLVYLKLIGSSGPESMGEALTDIRQE